MKSFRSCLLDVAKAIKRTDDLKDVVDILEKLSEVSNHDGYVDAVMFIRWNLRTKSFSDGMKELNRLIESNESASISSEWQDFFSEISQK